VGSKFLRAVIGGLNLTHNEAWPDFVARFGDRADVLKPCLDAFNADSLRQWAAGLGVETFVGSSGRVFPVAKKAAPLLRRWLQRLRSRGVQIHHRHHWQGWNLAGELVIQGPDQKQAINPDITVFALGGGSWSALGSTGNWLTLFEQRGIQCAPWQPSNCGFEYPWRPEFIAEYTGTPLKTIAITVKDKNNKIWRQQGDAVISAYGIEGGPVYGVSAPIRDVIAARGQCTVYWDLDPDRSLEKLQQAIAKRRAKDSLANVLRKQCGLTGAKLALLKTLTSKTQMADIDAIPNLIKALPQTLHASHKLDEAISTAGGLCFSELDENFMLKKQPGTYCVGEMLDWEAPTGGYLLTACFASGHWAGAAAAKRLVSLKAATNSPII
jgi:uncharacterized flavoprotein (TIGR03862 family)